MGDRYSFSLTTFAPSGKLSQIEHALAAVGQGTTSVGIKCKSGVVIATEKKAPSILVEEQTIQKVYQICHGIGLVYSGMGPDARVLANVMRKEAQKYWMIYREYPSVLMLVKSIGKLIQESTQSGGVRPYGVSLLVVGVDEDGPVMYQVDPSGIYFAWKATAIGKNMVNAKTFLEKRYTEEFELEDAVHTAIITLKEAFEGEMTPTSLDIGLIPNEPGAAFKRLTPAEIKDYLSNVA